MGKELIRTFEDLECWKACRKLRLFVAKELCPLLPKEERFRLADQAIRAARSTTSNIAEGYGRFHFLDNAKFCSNARGSVWEVLDHLITAHDENLIDAGMLETGRSLVKDAVPLVNGYIAYLRRASRSSASGETPITSNE